MLCEEPVYLHPTSSLLKIVPQYIVFQELVETRKLYMRGNAHLLTRLYCHVYQRYVCN